MSSNKRQLSSLDNAFMFNCSRECSGPILAFVLLYSCSIAQVLSGSQKNNLSSFQTDGSGEHTGMDSSRPGRA